MNENAPPAPAYVNTGIRLPADVLGILRRAAVYRAEIDGARVSVGAVVADLVRANAEILVRKP